MDFGLDNQPHQKKLNENRQQTAPVLALNVNQFQFFGYNFALKKKFPDSKFVILRWEEIEDSFIYNEYGDATVSTGILKHRKRVVMGIT